MTEQRRQVQVPAPQPTPVQFLIEVEPMADGSHWLKLQAFTPTGQAVYFLPPQVAIELAGLLAEEGQKAKAKPIVPVPGPVALPWLPPNGHKL